MDKIIATFSSEGYSTTFREDASGRVYGLADLDIDADGANGQNGGKAAYMVADLGSEYLANGGMKMQGGRVVPAASWFEDIVILDSTRHPREFPGGIIASKTSYRFQGKAADDPTAYVDSETIAYMVVQADIIGKTAGAVLGCRARATLMSQPNVKVDCIVADVGPRTKIGEGSIALARKLGLKSSPRNGGIEFPGILFELWPGQYGEIGGKKIPLLTSKGQYIAVP